MQIRANMPILDVLELTKRHGGEATVELPDGSKMKILLLKDENENRSESETKRENNQDDGVAKEEPTSNSDNVQS